MPLKLAQPVPHELYRAARIFQSANNAWAACLFWRCIAKSHCTGGPRGICRATGGFPVCTLEGQRRLELNKLRRKWQPEKGHENDSPGERAARHMELITKRVDFDALISETDRLAEQLRHK